MKTNLIISVLMLFLAINVYSQTKVYYDRPSSFLVYGIYPVMGKPTLTQRRIGWDAPYTNMNDPRFKYLKGEERSKAVMEVQRYERIQKGLQPPLKKK